jgi:hypothetical protein
MNEKLNRPDRPGGGTLAQPSAPAAPAPGRTTLPDAIQRKQNAAATGEASDVQETARAGLAGAGGQLPHLSTIQSAFGRHDVSGVRAHAGPEAAGAAAAIGASAYASGEAIAFGRTPDLHDAAHEAAHVIQQRSGHAPLGGVGATGDALEQHADRVADAVVAGESAEPLLDDLGEGDGGGTALASVQRRDLTEPIVNAEMYLDLNSWDARDEIAAHLSGISWPAPHARLPWGEQATFNDILAPLIKDYLFSKSRTGGHFSDPYRVRRLFHPHDPYRAIDQMRAIVGRAPHDGKNIFVGGLMGPAEWRPAIGRRIGALLEEAIVTSLQRMGGRYVAFFDRTGELPIDGTLMTSHQLDRFVGRALTLQDGVVKVQALPDAEDKGKKKKGDKDVVAPEPKRTTQKAEVRKVKLEWLGQQGKPKLWNWVRAVDPIDATVEEVAAEIYGNDKVTGDPATYLAYRFTDAAPMFGLGATWALHLDAMKPYAPKNVADEPESPNAVAVAESESADDVALAQAVDEAKPADPQANATAAQIQETLGDAIAQTAYIGDALAPWQLEIGAVQRFLGRKRVELATATTDQLATWQPVVDGVKGNLAQIGGGVAELVRATASMEIADRKGPDAQPIREILELYAEAAGCAHLLDTSRALILKAQKRQGGLTLRAAQASGQNLAAAIDDMRGATDTGDDTRKELVEASLRIEEEGTALRSKLIAGENVDQGVLDDHLIDADIVALKARVHGASVALGELEQAARAAGDGLAADFASIFSSDFTFLAGDSKHLRERLSWIVSGIQFDMQIASVSADSSMPPEERAAFMREHRRAALAKAQASFQQIQQEENLGKFLRRGAELVKWQQFRTACVKVAALIGVSLVAGAVGGLVTRAVGGAFVRAGAAATIGELSLSARMTAGAIGMTTDAAIASAGQTAIFGGSYGHNLLENMIANFGTHAVLKALSHNATVVAKVDAEAAALWGKGPPSKALQMGGIVLRETAAISGHAIMGAAFGYVAKRIVTGEKQPPPETLEEWLLQGASVAVGRYVGHAIQARMPANGRLMKAAEGAGAAIFKRAQHLLGLAKQVEQRPNPEQALELLGQRHRLLMDEIDLLTKMMDDPDQLAAAKYTRAEVRAMRDDLHAQLDEVHAQGFEAVPLHLAGLEELIPGAVWKGRPDQIEHALRSAQRSGIKVESERNPTTGKWKVQLDGRLLEIQEHGAAAAPPAAAARFESAPIEAGEAGSRALTTGMVPGSSFTGKAIAHADVDAAQVHAATLAGRVDVTMGGLTDVVPGVNMILRMDGTGRDFLVQLGDLSYSSVSVIFGPLEGNAVARAVINPTKEGYSAPAGGARVKVKGRHVIELSSGLHPDQVERAVAHQLATIVTAQAATRKGMPADAGDIGPNEHGRIAEMNLLARQIAEQPARAPELRREMVALVEHLGLRKSWGGEEGARVKAISKRLSPEARNELEAARREETSLDPAAKDQLFEIREAAQAQLTAELASISPGGVHRSPADLAPEGKLADRAQLAEAARMAARLREMVSEKTLTRYREQTRDLPARQYPKVDDFQLGGGAALAARRPGALLVDERGRWQADGSKDIAQTAHQLDRVRDASGGDPRQAAGPNDRVPLDAIRYWEDSIAAQGEVINGKARLWMDGGRLLATIEPTDASGHVTVELLGAPTIATGFPVERPPGAPRGITIADSILLIERQLRTIEEDTSMRSDVRDAAKNLAERLGGLSGETSDNAVRAHKVLADAPPELIKLLEALSTRSDRNSDALNVFRAHAEWQGVRANDLRDGQQDVFFGDEANLEAKIRKTFDPKNPHAPKHVVVAGTGGTAISAVEIVLATNPNTKVTMVGRDNPAGLVENDQFRQVARRHLNRKDARKYKLPHGDGRLRIVVDDEMDIQAPAVDKFDDGVTDRYEVIPGTGTEYMGDAYIAALGRENQVPPVVSELVMNARREAIARGDSADPVQYVPLYHEGQYVGYEIVITHRNGTSTKFEVTGGVSRFVPRAEAPDRDAGSGQRVPKRDKKTKEIREPLPAADPAALGRDESERIKIAGDMDAPAASGNFDAGYVASAIQAWLFGKKKQAP